MDERKQDHAGAPARGWDRRQFLKVSGAVYMVAAVGCEKERERPKELPPPPRPTEKVDLEKLAFPPSAGYLLVDVKKCQGCLSCMLACSLAHEGKENLSLARIQVVQDPFGSFPSDLTLEACRQCVDPACVEACPTGALHADREHGNVRVVREELCEGCMQCVEACPHGTSRSVWNHEEGKAVKCDLCAEAPYWKEKGGPDGKQACVEVCPLGAIRLTRQIPLQQGDAGYKVNLRSEAWAKMGYSLE
ncbi:MAG: 4Fe-4S dicluster domain-containing protein [bacterium]